MGEGEVTGKPAGGAGVGSAEVTGIPVQSVQGQSAPR